MRYRKLDAAGDFTLGTGTDYFVDSPAAVAQSILTRLRLNLGEWFLDTSDGTPWLTQVLGKYTQAGYDAVIKARIADTAGVKAIVSYSSSFDRAAHRLAVAATVETVYGQNVNVSVSL